MKVPECWARGPCDGSRGGLILLGMSGRRVRGALRRVLSGLRGASILAVIGCAAIVELITRRGVGDHWEGFCNK